jgi:hypothetical protein
VKSASLFSSSSPPPSIVEDDEDDDEDDYLDSSFLSNNNNNNKAQPTQSSFDASSSRLSSSAAGQSSSLSDRPESGHDSSSWSVVSLGDDFSSFLTVQAETKHVDDSSTSVRESSNKKAQNHKSQSQNEKRPELARLNDSSISASIGGDDDDDYFAELVVLPEAKPSVKWSEESNCINLIERLSHSSMDRMFYTEEELADQRHEAWCEECGLDPRDFQ